MPQYAKGLTFLTSSSRRGRSMTSAKGTHGLVSDDSLIPPNVKAHNDAIEAARKERLKARKGRK